MSSHFAIPAATTVNGVLREPLGRSFRAAKNKGPAEQSRLLFKEVRVWSSAAVGEIELNLAANLAAMYFERAKTAAIKVVIVRVEVKSGELLKGKVERDGIEDVEEDEEEALILKDRGVIAAAAVVVKERVFLVVSEEGRKGFLGFKRKRD